VASDYNLREKQKTAGKHTWSGATWNKKKVRVLPEDKCQKSIGGSSLATYYGY
jgi:hypothetical protein